MGAAPTGRRAVVIWPWGIQKGYSSMKTNRLFVAAVVVTAVAAPIAGFGEDMKVPLREWNRCVSSQH